MLRNGVHNKILSNGEHIRIHNNGGVHHRWLQIGIHHLIIHSGVHRQILHIGLLRRMFNMDFRLKRKLKVQQILSKDHQEGKYQKHVKLEDYLTYGEPNEDLI